MKVIITQVEKEEVEVDEAMSSYDELVREQHKEQQKEMQIRAAGKTGVVQGVSILFQRKEKAC